MAVEDKDDGLKGKQLAALAALLSEPTIERTAKTAGVDAKSIYRWLREDAGFQRKYRPQRAVVTQAMSVLMKMTMKGLAVINRTLDSENEVLAYRAAVDIYDRAIHVVEVLDHEERLAAIEAQARPPQSEEVTCQSANGCGRLSRLWPPSRSPATARRCAVWSS